MQRKRIAINGLGRIGRLVLRKLVCDRRLEIVAVNDVAPLDILTYLIKHNTEHGSFDQKNRIGFTDNFLVMDDLEIPAYQEADARQLPWSNYAVDLVLDCSGAYTSRIKAQAHLDAGARKVLLSATAGTDVPTVVFSMNEHTLELTDTIISGASCSTVGLAPLARALNDITPIKQGISTTIHALTPTQMTLDNPQAKGNLRRSRTASSNIIPTSAAAAQAVGLIVPDLAGKLSGSAIRVPVTRGSLITLHALVESNTLSVESLNEAMKKYVTSWFAYTDDELVSSDIAGTAYEAIFDATQTKVAKAAENAYLVEVSAWFDNETSYVAHFTALAEHICNLT
ncbi:MAG: glyceraldehyde 3-phosphate dehydrogenase NAD-binding domain-containing protein [Gordonibacter sp.]|nr:glyceraldehyde 3-phosphate dehydrogenase NAD-binding domain-containing protein [Gordonibacter sp.]